SATVTSKVSVLPLPGSPPTPCTATPPSASDSSTGAAVPTSRASSAWYSVVGRTPCPGPTASRSTTSGVAPPVTVTSVTPPPRCAATWPPSDRSSTSCPLTVSVPSPPARRSTSSVASASLAPYTQNVTVSPSASSTPPEPEISSLATPSGAVYTGSPPSDRASSAS